MTVMNNKIIALVFTVSIAIPVLGQNGGADTYKAKCAMCHGADGVGNTPAGKAMKVKSFLEADLVKASDADLISATKNGKGKMPAYAGKLSDSQIKDVVAHVRTLQKAK